MKQKTVTGTGNCLCPHSATQHRPLFSCMIEARKLTAGEAVGRQLTCVFVDHGLMRLNEGDEVEAAFAKWDINFIRVDAEIRFLAKLAGVSEPER